MLSQGASVRSHPQRHNAISSAAAGGLLAVVRRLVEEYKVLEQDHALWDSPFFTAVRYARINVVRYLLTLSQARHGRCGVGCGPADAAWLASHCVSADHLAWIIRLALLTAVASPRSAPRMDSLRSRLRRRADDPSMSRFSACWNRCCRQESARSSFRWLSSQLLVDRWTC